MVLPKDIVEFLLWHFVAVFISFVFINYTKTDK
jgi:hypothetical protein